MTYLPNQGQSPDGSMVNVPISGVVKTTQTPLAAGASWSNTWTEGKLNGANAVHVSISSDQAGSYIIQFSNDGVNPIPFSISSIPYDPTVVKAFQFGVAPKAKYFQLVYTNGSTAQTEFFVEIRFTDHIQETVRSIGAPTTSTQLAAMGKGPIEQPANPSNTTAAYQQPTVSVVSGRQGLDVNVLNPSTTTGLTDTQLRANPVPVSGTVTTNPTQPSTSTPTSVTSTGSSSQVLAANSNRKSASIYCVGGTAYIKFGAGATTSAGGYKVKLTSNALYEFPAPIYTGVVHTIGTATLSVSEES